MPAHDKSRHCNDRNVPGPGVTSESAGHFQPKYFGPLDIHHNKIGRVRERQIDLEDYLDQIAWRAGLLMVDRGDIADDSSLLDRRQPPASSTANIGRHPILLSVSMRLHRNLGVCLLAYARIAAA